MCAACGPRTRKQRKLLIDVELGSLAGGYRRVKEAAEAWCTKGGMRLVVRSANRRSVVVGRPVRRPVFEVTFPMQGAVPGRRTGGPVAATGGPLSDGAPR